MAAEINRGGGSQNFAVPNVEEPHIYRGGGKNFHQRSYSSPIPQYGSEPVAGSGYRLQCP